MVAPAASGTEKVVIQDSNGQDVIIEGGIQSPQIKGGVESPVVKGQSTATTVQGQTTPVVLTGSKSSVIINAKVAGSQDEYVAAVQGRIDTARAALQGTQKFKNPQRIKDRNLNWDSYRHDKVQGRLVKTAAKADEEGIRPSKKKRLEKQEARLEKRLYKIENRNSRLDVIMDASGDLGIKTPASFAETKVKLLGLGEGITVAVQVEAPAKSPEELIQLGLNAYRLVNEFALPAGSARIDEIKAQAALQAAGKEYDEQLGILSRLPADSGARVTVQRKLDEILAKNPRMQAILNAAKALGLENPNFAQAYARLEQLDAEDKRRTAQLFEFEAPERKPRPVETAPSPEVQNLNMNSYNFLDSALEKDKRTLSEDPYDNTVAKAYQNAADSFYQLALKTQDPEQFINQARALVKAENYEAAKIAIETGVSLATKKSKQYVLLLGEANAMLEEVKNYIAGDGVRKEAQSIYSRNISTSYRDRNEQLEKSANMLEGLAKSNNGTAKDLLRAGLIYLQLNKPSDAYRCLKGFADRTNLGMHVALIESLIKKYNLKLKAEAAEQNNKHWKSE